MLVTKQLLVANYFHSVLWQNLYFGVNYPFKVCTIQKQYDVRVAYTKYAWTKILKKQLTKFIFDHTIEIIEIQCFLDPADFHCMHVLHLMFHKRSK